MCSSPRVLASYCITCIHHIISTHRASCNSTCYVHNNTVVVTSVHRGMPFSIMCVVRSRYHLPCNIMNNSNSNLGRIQQSSG